MWSALYLVQDIVQRHGDTISVASAEGQGSTFSVCLPCTAETASSERPTLCAGGIVARFDT